jgi:hypothetical protein
VIVLKIKRVLKIVAVFILLLSALSLLTSGSFFLLQKYLFRIDFVQEYSFWQFSLYILGYGASPNVDIGMQLLLGIIGIIMISLLSAFLTVNLFRRAKDVLISNHIVVWKDQDGEYFASILIGNQGKPICNVSVAAQLFDCVGETKNIGNNSFAKPIIIRNHIWRVDFDVKIGSFMYEYFQDALRNGGLMQLYVLVSFVDTDTGQESIICKEYKYSNVAVVNREKGFIYPENKLNIKENMDLNNRKSMGWKQFKEVVGDKTSQEKFHNFICANVAKIDMQGVIPIVENGDHRAIRIMHELQQDQEIQAMTVAVNFNKLDKNLSNPSFVMALIQFLPFNNWSPYYEKNYRLEFDISSSAEISFVQLEIKDKMKNKIFDKTLATAEEAVHYSFYLHELGSIEKWVEVHEICFTVFSHFISKPKGEFTVKDLKLVESNELK